jgi:hypothetical protein
LSRQDFTFDKERNVYVCPQGKLLRTRGRIHDGVTLLYRARTSDCGPCPLKPRCWPRHPSAGSHAASMRMPVMSPEHSLAPSRLNSHAAVQSASRCCLLRLGRSDRAGRAVRKTSSRSALSHKTSPACEVDHSISASSRNMSCVASSVCGPITVTSMRLPCDFALRVVEAVVTDIRRWSDHHSMATGPINRRTRRGSK